MTDSGANPIGYFGELISLSIVVLPVYYGLPWRLARNILLAAFGAWLMFTVAPRLLLFYLAYWLFLYVAQRAVLWSQKGKASGTVFFTMLTLAISPMLLWKAFPYDSVVMFNLETHRLVGLLPGIFSAIDAVKYIILPLGLSFACFRGGDLLIQTHLGAFGPIRLHALLCYGLYPPILLVGPVAEYRELALDAPLEPFSAGDIAVGLANISMGLVKLFVFAYPLGMVGKLQGVETQTTFNAWISLVAFAWHLYLNFAGYSDLAIGCARLYGHRLQANFSFPFFKTGPAEFWQSWHMSLTRFVWRNIYIPAGGMRSKTQYLALLLATLTIAFWHALSVPMLLFGLYHAAGLMVQRRLASRRGRKAAAGGLFQGLKMVGTFLYVALSLPMLVLPLEQLPKIYFVLFGGRP